VERFNTIEMVLDIIKFAKQKRISKTNALFCQNACPMATLIVKCSRKIVLKRDTYVSLQRAVYLWLKSQ